MLNAADLTRAVSGMRADSSLNAQSTEAAIKSKSLLVVDDSATIRTLEKSILEAAGYTVTLAADGMEAWDLLQNEKFDVVVSDINMPRMDGIELTTKIREQASLKDLPVVLVTSLGSAADKEKGLHAGADAYIVKSSFEQEILLSTISGLL
jgi:two-component system, chemotaxis family, sensor kinase CheA